MGIGMAIAWMSMKTLTFSCEPMHNRWHPVGYSCEEQMESARRRGWVEVWRIKRVGIDSVYFDITIRGREATR